MSKSETRIYGAMRPFWRGVHVCRIRGTKLWRIEVSRKNGLEWRETKDCAYAILDALCPDMGGVCVVSIV